MLEEKFNKYYKEMMIEEKDNKIRFIFFINNCKPNTKGLNNTKYGLFQISYLNYNKDPDNYSQKDLDIIDIANDPLN